MEKVSFFPRSPYPKLHYSKPGDFNFGDGGISESFRLIEDHYQVCLYGFDAGDFRRHIR